MATALAQVLDQRPGDATRLSHVGRPVQLPVVLDHRLVHLEEIGQPGQVRDEILVPSPAADDAQAGGPLRVVSQVVASQLAHPRPKRRGRVDQPLGRAGGPVVRPCVDPRVVHVPGGQRQLAQVVQALRIEPPRRKLEKTRAHLGIFEHAGDAERDQGHFSQVERQRTQPVGRNRLGFGSDPLEGRLADAVAVVINRSCHDVRLFTMHDVSLLRSASPLSSSG